VLHRRVRRERELRALGEAAGEGELYAGLGAGPLPRGDAEGGLDVDEGLLDGAVEGERPPRDVEVAPVELDLPADDLDGAEELVHAAGLLLHEERPGELDVEDGVLPAAEPHVSVDVDVEVEREVLHEDGPRRVGLGDALAEG